MSWVYTLSQFCQLWAIETEFSFLHTADYLPGALQNLLRPTPKLESHVLLITCQGGGRGGGRRRHSHISADIICQKTPFLRKSHTQWPYFSLQSTPNDPLFSKFQNKIQIFSTHCKIFYQIIAKIGKFSFKFDKIYTKWPPILGSSHQKGLFFLDPTPKAPIFSTKSYTECPLFLFSGRHMYTLHSSSDCLQSVYLSDQGILCFDHDTFHLAATFFLSSF